VRIRQVNHEEHEPRGCRSPFFALFVVCAGLDRGGEAMKRNDAGRAPTSQCLRLLIAFQRQRWSAPAWSLNRLGMLNERGRISDLRHRWGLLVKAEPRGRRGHTVYTIPPGQRREARRLIREGKRRSAGL